MRNRRPALRGRLIALLVAGTAVVWGLIAVGTYVDVRHHAGRIFDAQLSEYAEVLSAVAGHEAYEMAGATTTLEHEHGQACTYQVYSPDGSLLLRSHAAPPTPLAAHDGFSDVESAGLRWRAFRRVDAANALVIIVAHRLDERQALVADFALRALWPMLAGLPLLALVVWIAVTRAVAPLERLAAQLRGREPRRLVPVESADAPREIEPLIEALNELFARVQRSFENERRFTGDAAHELRTPLAALRTHAEVALTTANSDRRRRALERVVSGVDRATRLVDQLLTLARLDAAQPTAGEPLDLAELVREGTRALRPEAVMRGVEVRVAAPAALAVHGEPTMLEVLLRNLVENAIRHAGAKGMVRVTLVPEGDHATLEVQDSGPGVDPELRERIFDRHFRAPGDSGGAAGLGLSIARRIVALHGGTIAAEAGRTLPGLRVVVTLPITDKDSLRSAAHAAGVTQPEEIPT